MNNNVKVVVGSLEVVRLQLRLLHEYVGKDLRQVEASIDARRSAPGVEDKDEKSYPELLISRAVYFEVGHVLGTLEPEAGGLLIGPKNHPGVTHFELDADAKRTATTFEVDASRVNRMLEPFLHCGLHLKGIVHSHPPGANAPSDGDIQYLRKLFRGKDVNDDGDMFFFPIVERGIFHPFAYRPASAGRREHFTKATVRQF